MSKFSDDDIAEYNRLEIENAEKEARDIWERNRLKYSLPGALESFIDDLRTAGISEVGIDGLVDALMDWES